MTNNNEIRVKECLICGTSFSPERSTKKYCSDNCKQNAFYQRNSITGISINDKTGITSEGFASLSLPHQKPVANISLSAVQTLNDNQENPGGNKIPEGQPNIDKYEPVRSPFIEAVADAVDEAEGIERMFNDHFSPWSGGVLEAVKKINISLRSLLENLLLLSRQSTIRRKTFVLIRNAFNSMCGSAYFKNLPTDYPYTEFIKEIENICNKTAAEHKKGTDFRLRLSLKRKIEFISVRFILSTSTPFVSFHDLHFEDELTLNAAKKPTCRIAARRRRYS